MHSDMHTDVHTDIASNIEAAEATPVTHDRRASRWRLLPSRARRIRDTARRYREIAAAERARAQRLATAGEAVSKSD
jgi:hypothetical protein